MLTASLRRKTLLLLLAAVLAAPWTLAAAPRTESPSPAQAIESSPLELFSRVWSFLQDAWSKSNCHIDPNGLCSDGSAQPPDQTKSSCGIDPDGRCKP